MIKYPRLMNRTQIAWIDLATGAEAGFMAWLNKKKLIVKCFS